MRNRTPITYPRNWTETRKIFMALDVRWIETTKEPNKHVRSRELLKIIADVNQLYRAAQEQTNTIGAQVEIKRELYKNAKILEKPDLFAGMMGEAANLNFHEKVLRTTLKWMKHKKIPKKY